MCDDDEYDSEYSTENPYFLFQLLQSDVIAAEIDWNSERFLFYPVNTLPDSYSDVSD